jgi:hypothetical protein
MSFLSLVKRTPSAVLLGVQLLGVVLYPLMESSPRGRALFGIFGLLVLGIALRVVRSGPWLTWIAFTLAVPIVVLTGIELFDPSVAIETATAALHAVFYLYAAGSLIAYMLNDTHVAADDLFAAGATFTLLAWAFAYLFVVCQALQPGAFGTSTSSTGAPVPRSWTELLYCSVAVLSSVGLSDVLPVSPMARSLVMLASFTGVLYIALVVSRLISLTAAARSEPGKP